METVLHPCGARGPAFILVLVACLCLGMAGFGDSGVVTKIPKPERSFLVELVDAENVSFALTDFSMNGLTLIPVTAGKAQISLDFSQIAEVRLYLQDDHVLGRVVFHDTSSSDFFLDPGLVFYGITSWGNMMIKAKDIRRIVFKGRVDASAQPAPVKE